MEAVVNLGAGSGGLGGSVDFLTDFFRLRRFESGQAEERGGEDAREDLADAVARLEFAIVEREEEDDLVL